MDLYCYIIVASNIQYPFHEVFPIFFVNFARYSKNFIPPQNMYMTRSLKYINFIVITFASINIVGQSQYWQQSVKYVMDVNFNIKKHQFSGKQTILYTNNSPDTLYKVFYHLYLNAFQPNSAMDVRSRNLPDPDKRVASRILKLDKKDQGWQKVKYLLVNGQEAVNHVEGTILEVTLPKPILPESTVTLEMEWEAQVPEQVRRTGKFNKEGIEYTMTQWYPKLCNYDYQGWHANPYVAREFYGIWGDYDVSITLPANYVVGATGILQNPDQVGHGYAAEINDSNKNLTWRFKAENVHDFAWAADPDYKHIVHKAHDGTLLRFFYQPGNKTDENWAKLPEIMDEALKFIEQKYGDYPYPQYSFIQGGDGGMEYPMATMITGERGLISLVGVAVHEWMHSWYQMILATNEALYPWMDEGFTSYASAEVMNYLKVKKLLPGEPEENPHLESVQGLITFNSSGQEEALSTHADHYQTNSAYGVGSYTKGEVFLEQLRYIIGESAFDRTMLRYYHTWKFKHPNPNDFIRCAEKESGLELDWFKEYFVNTTHTVDYDIEEFAQSGVVIRRRGLMPMPLDITVTDKKGKKKYFYIPLDIMRGEKKGDRFFENFRASEDWTWTHPTYYLDLNMKSSDIEKVEIDESKRLVDIDRTNNIYPRLVMLENQNK
jgi:hypothetical protein